MDDIVIIDGVRTPTGRFQGSLAKFSATELGAKVIEALKERNNLGDKDVDEVIMGNVVQAGTGQAPARQASINGGISPEVPAVAVNKVCGSGLKAVIMAAQAIKAGDAKMIIAGGMESMSNVPYGLPGARKGYRLWDKKVKDLMVYDGLWCTFNDQHMGMSAEYIAEKENISRPEQDKFALQSHKKAIWATEEGKFKSEICPLETKEGKLSEDETIRYDTSLEALAQLPPVFKKDGTVTAGNAPGLNDGASATLIASKKEAEKRGYKPMATIEDYAISAVAPLEVFYAPVKSTQMLLKKMDRDINCFDLIEINEAFSAQTLADGSILGWDWDKVNVHGGAVALGHPIGSSGSRILTTLIHAMMDRDVETGLAAICMGGGNGISLNVKRKG